MKKLLPLLALVSIHAVAQQRPDPFPIWDRNQDSKLTPDEVPEGLRKNFERIDTNKDGFISKEEHQTVFARLTKAPIPTTPRLPDNLDAKRDIPYAGTENPRQRLDLYLPKKRESDKPLPVIVFIHGGACVGHLAGLNPR